MILNSTRKLQIVLTGAVTTNELQVVTDYIDVLGVNETPGGYQTTTNGTTPVDIVFAPTTTTHRKIKLIQVFQRDTTAKTVQISTVVAGVAFQMTNVTLQPDDVLNYTEGNGWKVMDASGNAKQNTSTATNLVAVSATTITANTFAGGAAPAAINGLAAAQGGALNITGGTSSTAANAGGAITVTGGVPGATGAGGAVTVTTGAGGATSGVSGDMTLATGTTTAGSGSATGQVIVQSGAGAASAVAVAGGASGAMTVRTQAGGANTGGATGQAGGTAGTLTVSTGAGGATNTTGAQAAGNGGEMFIATGNGGNATAGTGNGGKAGDIYITPGTGGTSVGGTAGADGSVYVRGKFFGFQSTPAAKTVSATLTAAEVLSGIITVAQGGGAASAQQLPLATAMDTALPDAVANDAFDFSVINISAVAAETASVTTNTGWTLVGNMLLAANTAVTDNSQGRFRARKTGVGTWTLYRIS